MKSVVLLLLVATVLFAQESVPYKNKSLPIEKRVEDLLSRLTLNEKIDLLGRDGFCYKRN
jgi:beta-glucosidase